MIRLDQLTYEAKAKISEAETTLNSFLILYNSQFLENRVQKDYDSRKSNQKNEQDSETLADSSKSVTQAVFDAVEQESKDANFGNDYSKLQTEYYPNILESASKSVSDIPVSSTIWGGSMLTSFGTNSHFSQGPDVPLMRSREFNEDPYLGFATLVEPEPEPTGESEIPSDQGPKFDHDGLPMPADLPPIPSDLSGTVFNLPSIPGDMSHGGSDIMSNGSSILPHGLLSNPSALLASSGSNDLFGDSSDDEADQTSQQAPTGPKAPDPRKSILGDLSAFAADTSSLFSSPASNFGQSNDLFGGSSDDEGDTKTAPQTDIAASLVGSDLFSSRQDPGTSSASLFGDSNDLFGTGNGSSTNPKVGGSSGSDLFNTTTTTTSASNDLFGGSSDSDLFATASGNKSAGGNQNQNQPKSQASGGGLFGEDNSLFGGQDTSSNDKPSLTSQNDLFGGDSNSSSDLFGSVVPDTKVKKSSRRQDAVGPGGLGALTANLGSSSLFAKKAKAAGSGPRAESDLFGSSGASADLFGAETSKPTTQSSGNDLFGSSSSFDNPSNDSSDLFGGSSDLFGSSKSSLVSKPRGVDVQPSAAAITAGLGSSDLFAKRAKKNTTDSSDLFGGSGSANLVDDFEALMGGSKTKPDESKPAVTAQADDIFGGSGSANLVDDFEALMSGSKTKPDESKPPVTKTDDIFGGSGATSTDLFGGSSKPTATTQADDIFGGSGSANIVDDFEALMGGSKTKPIESKPHVTKTDDIFGGSGATSTDLFGGSSNPTPATTQTDDIFGGSGSSDLFGGSSNSGPATTQTDDIFGGSGATSNDLFGESTSKTVASEPSPDSDVSDIPTPKSVVATQTDVQKEPVQNLPSVSEPIAPEIVSKKSTKSSKKSSKKKSKGSKASKTGTKRSKKKSKSRKPKKVESKDLLGDFTSLLGGSVGEGTIDPFASVTTQDDIFGAVTVDPFADAKPTPSETKATDSGDIFTPNSSNDVFGIEPSTTVFSSSEPESTTNTDPSLDDFEALMGGTSKPKTTETAVNTTTPADDIFGASVVTTDTTKSSSDLFGDSSSADPFGSPSTTGSDLFGDSSTTKTEPSLDDFEALIGGTTKTTPTPKDTTTSADDIFGASNVTTNEKSSSDLFGDSSSADPFGSSTPGSDLFGDYSSTTKDTDTKTASVDDFEALMGSTSKPKTTETTVSTTTPADDLFGASVVTTDTTKSSSDLFGDSSSDPFGSSSTTGSDLFGGSSSTTKDTDTKTASVDDFEALMGGRSKPKPKETKTPAEDLFGSSDDTTIPKTSSSSDLFGNSSTGSDLFGSSTTSTTKTEPSLDDFEALMGGTSKPPKESDKPASADDLFGTTNVTTEEKSTSASDLFGDSSTTTTEASVDDFEALMGGKTSQQKAETPAIVDDTHTSSEDLFGSSNVDSDATKSSSTSDLFGDSSTTKPEASLDDFEALMGASAPTSKPKVKETTTSAEDLFGSTNDTKSSSSDLFGDSSSTGSDLFGGSSSTTKDIDTNTASLDDFEALVGTTKTTPKPKVTTTSAEDLFGSSGITTNDTKSSSSDLFGDSSSDPFGSSTTGSDLFGGSSSISTTKTEPSLDDFEALMGGTSKPKTTETAINTTTSADDLFGTSDVTTDNTKSSSDLFGDSNTTTVTTTTTQTKPSLDDFEALMGGTTKTTPKPKVTTTSAEDLFGSSDITTNDTKSSSSDLFGDSSSADPFGSSSTTGSDLFGGPSSTTKDTDTNTASLDDFEALMGGTTKATPKETTTPVNDLFGGSSTTNTEPSLDDFEALMGGTTKTTPKQPTNSAKDLFGTSNVTPNENSSSSSELFGGSSNLTKSEASLDDFEALMKGSTTKINSSSQTSARDLFGDSNLDFASNQGPPPPKSNSSAADLFGSSNNDILGNFESLMENSNQQSQTKTQSSSDLFGSSGHLDDFESLLKSTSSGPPLPSDPSLFSSQPPLDDFESLLSSSTSAATQSPNILPTLEESNEILSLSNSSKPRLNHLSKATGPKGKRRPTRRRAAQNLAESKPAMQVEDRLSARVARNADSQPKYSAQDGAKMGFGGLGAQIAAQALKKKKRKS